MRKTANPSRSTLLAIAAFAAILTPSVSSAQLGVNLDSFVSKTLRDEPYRLDPRSATVYGDVGNRAPQFDNAILVDKPEGMNQPVAPGDYAVTMIAYGMMFGKHQPGKAQGYKLAQLEGHLAPTINLLLVRGTMKGASPEELNALVWRIETGVTLNELNEADRGLVQSLIPEFQDALTKDYFHDLRSKYNGVGRFLNGNKSFEDAIASTGDSGRYASVLVRAKPILMNKRAVDGNLPGVLLSQLAKDSSPLALPEPNPQQESPWAMVLPGVFCRINVQGGVWGKNFMEIHVGTNADKSLTLAKILAIADADKPGTLDSSSPTAYLAYPEDDAATPLLLVPCFQFAQ